MNRLLVLLMVAFALVCGVGGQAEAQSSEEVRSFHEAIREGDLSAIDRFYREHNTVDVAIPGLYGPQPGTAFVAVESGNSEVLRRLLEHGLEQINEFSHPDGALIGSTPLSNAVSRNQPELVRLLLDAGARGDQRSQTLARAVETGNAEIVRLLLDSGADPDQASALRVASAHNNTRILRLLLDAGADPSTGAPLVTATYWDSDDAARLLQSRGAEPGRAAPIGARQLRRHMFQPEPAHPDFGLIPGGEYTIGQVQWLKVYRLHGTRIPLSYTARASSSLADDPPYFYGPDQAFDENPRTAWNEGDDGSGTGEWLELEFDAAGFSGGWAQIAAVEILGGLFASGWFEQNNRVSSARVVFRTPRGDWSPPDIYFPDSMTPVRTTFRPIWARSVRIEVLETYPGTAWNDLPISEVRFFAEITQLEHGEGVATRRSLVLIALEGYERPPEPAGWVIGN